MAAKKSAGKKSAKRPAAKPAKTARAVYAQAGPTQAKELATRTGVTYDLLYDPAAGFVADVGVVSLPSTLFVDEHGTVVATKTGKMDAGQLRAKLAELYGA